MYFYVETKRENSEANPMDNDFNDELRDEEEAGRTEEAAEAGHSNYKIPDIKDESVRHHLSGMFQNWFLDYASYVILDRSIPHLLDGLKPVQRRVLYSMKRMDDGRYNKVANIVGHTMQFHPHGDASIGDALVKLGQQDYLIDCQGNWGNTLTGDGAAAPRYIEARLSKFALEVLFNNKTTEWQLSYDGRNREPIALPVKFPLLLAQGTQGIGVGLSTKIMPHNFNELADASIACLRGEPFSLYPDFPTGGYIDVSRYEDGRRGGRLQIRAKIEKLDNKTLCIREIPYETNTRSLIESILRANEKGKIQIRKIEDNTAAEVEILIHLAPGRSSDKTIDALYAFTDCQMNISPNCCVIYQDKPQFLSVSEVIKFSTDNTLKLLKQELLIRKAEIQESIFYQTLERIFITERIYKDAEYENAGSQAEAVRHIFGRLEPFKDKFIREIEEEDIVKLFAIEMRRIMKFNADKADDSIAALFKELEKVNYDLEHIVDYTINWFEHIRDAYGSRYPRRTEIRSFDSIEASTVVEANEKLYINRTDGFIGTALKKDEFVCNCSNMDEIIVFFKDGKYKLVRVGEKVYVGKNVLHLAVFKKNDTRTIYNMVYRNGQGGPYYMKRFYVTGIARDKEYDLTQGKPGSKILYFSATPNGEAETVRVVLKPRPRVKSNVIEKDFGALAIKGRSSMGNLLTKFDVLRIQLKHKGASTLGGRRVWFDSDVLRLNYDGRGECIGEFAGEDLVLVITRSAECFTTSFDSSNHYPDDILRIEKYDPEKIWTEALFDADQGYVYLKRFTIEAGPKRQTLLNDNPGSRLLLLTDERYPRIQFEYAGENASRDPLVIDADEFIGVKSVKARGKRVTTFEVAAATELEPIEKEPPETEEAEVEDPEAPAPEDEGAAEATGAEESDGSSPLKKDEDGNYRLF